ncbi:MAG TPA: hypothetical protein VGQ76_28010 [Thermoanaerobaculia bacterium]|jgi:hypothetical protein|nr:hypothetical protein [Thermoanaerobaculia bacterium]
MTTDWDEMARAKLVRVLGATEGEIVFARTLAKMGKRQLRAADDVYRFAQVLKSDSPVIAAIGSMLALSAVIRGADPASFDRTTV